MSTAAGMLVLLIPAAEEPNRIEMLVTHLACTALQVFKMERLPSSTCLSLGLHVLALHALYSSSAVNCLMLKVKKMKGKTIGVSSS